VELHDGRIEATSAGVGHGAEFCVRLPFARRDVRPMAQPRQRTEKRARRVLLVDDNADIVESLAMLLRLEGHAVRGAGSGPEALAVARDFRPEVLLLDIGMPRMNGYELALRLRQEPGLEGATLIAVTGWGTLADQEKAMAAGFDFHLTKPVDPGCLLPMLDRSAH
jgi:CheY-like chemotaxis protein